MTSVKKKLKNSTVGKVLEILDEQDCRGSILVFKGGFGATKSSGKSRKVPIIPYNHFAVYIGKDKDGDHCMVHYFPDDNDQSGKRKAIIKKDKLVKIYDDMNWPCCIHNYLSGLKPHSPEKIVNRAEEALKKGQKAYNLVANNCEHFANWCRYGESCSLQAEIKGGAVIGGVSTVGLAAATVGAVGIGGAVIVGTVFAAPVLIPTAVAGVAAIALGAGSTAFGCNVPEIIRRKKKIKND